MKGPKLVDENECYGMSGPKNDNCCQCLSVSVSVVKQWIRKEVFCDVIRESQFISQLISD